MPGRTRPIEKFAEAVAKCSAEVSTFASRKANSPSSLNDGLVGSLQPLDVV